MEVSEFTPCEVIECNGLTNHTMYLPKCLHNTKFFSLFLQVRCVQNSSFDFPENKKYLFVVCSIFSRHLSKLVLLIRASYFWRAGRPCTDLVYSTHEKTSFSDCSVFTYLLFDRNNLPSIHNKLYRLAMYGERFRTEKRYIFEAFPLIY